MALEVAGEPFVTVEDVDCDCDDADPGDIEALIDQASDIIAVLTGGKVAGRTTETVFPVPGEYGCGRVLNRGAWVALRGPNPTVDQILIDGVVFTDHLILDGLWLVRTDGERWPHGQDPINPTFEVTYTYGLEVNVLARRACVAIVCDMLNNRPDKPRKLAANARAATISGVNITLEQTAMEMKRRSFMIPDLVRLLTVYAPDGPQPSVVYSPEIEDPWVLHRQT